MRNHLTPELDPEIAETVRRLYVRPIDDGRARRDVAMIAEAALNADRSRGPAASSRAALRARRRRLPLWRPALAAAAAAVAVPGGMATAGVNVPEPFEAPYDLVGISLPNQGEHAAAPAKSTRERPARSTEATPPAVTVPPRTTPAATTQAAPSTTPAEERAERARRRRAQRATPAVPATPARPGEGERGSRATPATPATPAQPARPARPERTDRAPRSQERSTTVGPERRQTPKTAREKRSLPARRRGGSGRAGLDATP